MRRSGALLAFAALLAASGTAARASSGQVTDRDGKPVAGARVCYLSVERETLCVQTDEQGTYRLPASGIEKLRISARGYLPVKLPSGARATPVRLDPAAAIRVELRDAASGAPIAGAEIHIIASSGHDLGPLPTGSQGVMRFLTLRPGLVRLTAAADGYEAVRGHDVELEAGRETLVFLGMKPATSE